MRKIIIFLTIFSLLSCNRKEEIPKELEYSFEYLNEVWSPEDIEVFKNIKENDTTPNNLHFGIGLHLRNNLLRHHAKSDSIVAYFNSLGITHYDYMSGLILYSYHQHLNNEKVDISKQVNEIIEQERPFVECQKAQKIIAIENNNKFRVNDTINIKMPVNEHNSVVDYGCPNLDWEFRKSFDLEVQGVILEKEFNKAESYGQLIVQILSKNHKSTKIFANEKNVGDNITVGLSDTAWKIE